MIRSSLRDERGLTFPELMVGLLIGLIVLGGIVTMVVQTAKTSGRVSERVAADQIARPMVQRIMDELHSACISPGLAPILSGSTDKSISFVYGTGSDVAPTPTKHTITLDTTAKTLTDTTYPKTGGTAPNWTFSTTPSSTYRILSNAGPIGGNSQPLFTYHAFSNGSISSTPLAVPLSSTDAARTVEVRMNLAVTPRTSATSSEAGAPVNIQESALLRFTPANEDTAQAGLPCT
ncbi:MAG: hypothetical protein U0R51_04000 [Solirubrobacterales bacterium]